MLVRTRFKTLALAALLLSISGGVPSVYAQEGEEGWSKPHPPFQISDNLYFVGTEGISDVVITTPAGSILVANTVPDMAWQIRDNMEKLGLKYSDIKLILTSHGHFDHVGGNAIIKKDTGAKYMVMDKDVAMVEAGGNGPRYWPGTKVDRVLKNGDTVELGGVVLTAYRTGGHTPGSTTYTMKTTYGGKTYDVVFLGGITMGRVPSVTVNLVNNPKYPTVAQDYKESYDILNSLKADIFLSAHSHNFYIKEKYEKYLASGKNVVGSFIDGGESYKRYIGLKQQIFENALKYQTKAFKEGTLKIPYRIPENEPGGKGEE